MALIARFGYDRNTVQTCLCSPAEQIGDFVCIIGFNAGKHDVRKANPFDYNFMPAVGVIINKLTDTTCLVQWLGETPSIFTGLSPGEIYFLGADGRISEYPPRPVDRNVFVQIVGIATSPTKIYVRPESGLVLRKA